MTSKMFARFSGFERNARGLAVKFDIIGNVGMLKGEVVAGCISGYSFPSYGAALKAARRAEAVVNSTGKLPNMCQWF